MHVQFKMVTGSHTVEGQKMYFARFLSASTGKKVYEYNRINDRQQLENIKNIINNDFKYRIEVE